MGSTERAMNNWRWRKNYKMGGSNEGLNCHGRRAKAMKGEAKELKGECKVECKGIERAAEGAIKYLEINRESQKGKQRHRKEKSYEGRVQSYTRESAKLYKVIKGGRKVMKGEAKL